MASLSALLIHGFMAAPANLAALRDCLEAAGIRCAAPALAGHGTRPSDMAGTGWERWRADVTEAFESLRREGGEIAVVGHSMGGLLALELAQHRPRDLAAVVALAPAVCVRDPLDALAPLLARIRKTWRSPIRDSYSSADYAARSANYPWFDTAAYLTWRAARRHVLAGLHHVVAPMLVLHSRADRVVPPRAAELVMAGVSSSRKEIAWFERSGHEMIEDCETEAVCDRITRFLRALPALGGEDHRGRE
jgi:carboxylesterase